MAIVWSAVACGQNSSGSSEVSAPASGSPAAMEAAAGTTVEWPVTRCGTYSGEGCAPTSDRVDVERPKFSNPTQITNPLFPISALDSVVLLGEVDGLPFRSETTLIPGTQSVVMQELHLDGSVSDKIFAPGYGEFDSSHGADVEALALALPNDAIDEVVPAELRLLSTSAWGILENPPRGLGGGQSDPKPHAELLAGAGG
ncbi:MAG: hypothetical protein LC739_13435 [Actinobacteria bacterium]|nr:hypothetical protein [Actinomycetota bacterium]